MVRRTIAGVSSALLIAVGFIAASAPALAEDAVVTTGNELVSAFRCGGDDACTVTVADDLTTTVGPAVAAGRTVTLDLAGHDVTIEQATINTAGIGVPSGATLIITDSGDGGTLTVTGARWGAGIGGDDTEDAGTITIDGGDVTAHGGGLAAGVGGGNGGDGGNVTIGPDGSLSASAPSTSSAAIGAGQGGDGLTSLSNAGTLTIPASSTLSIPEGVTVTNSGTITGGGIIVNRGAILNSGTIDQTDLQVTRHNYQIAFDTNGGNDDGPAPLELFATPLEAGGLTMPTTQPTRAEHGFAAGTPSRPGLAPRSTSRPTSARPWPRTVRARSPSTPSGSSSRAAPPPSPPAPTLPATTTPSRSPPPSPRHRPAEPSTSSTGTP